MNSFVKTNLKYLVKKKNPGKIITKTDSERNEKLEP